jgi:hypothetical protein
MLASCCRHTNNNTFRLTSFSLFQVGPAPGPFLCKLAAGRINASVALVHVKVRCESPHACYQPLLCLPALALIFHLRWLCSIIFVIDCRHLLYMLTQSEQRAASHTKQCQSRSVPDGSTLIPPNSHWKPLPVCVLWIRDACSPTS